MKLVHVDCLGGRDWLARHCIGLVPYRCIGLAEGDLDQLSDELFMRTLNSDLCRCSLVVWSLPIDTYPGWSLPALRGAGENRSGLKSISAPDKSKVRKVSALVSQVATPEGQGVRRSLRGSRDV